MTDIWVCANCRSVNNLRAKQCYNCRTPKDRAAVDPADVDATTKGKLREIALPDYEPSRPFAILAAVMIIAVAVVQALNSFLSVDEVVETVDEFGFTVVTIDTVSPLALPTYVVAGAALVAFAVWLSRAVGSMPALGLGYPAATATTAFLEVFIPGLNLMRIPAIMRDMIRRLEPQEGRGDVLIYAAWIGLFGGILLPRIGLYLGLFGANTSDTGATTLVVVRLFSTLLVLGGAIFLVALIWWIEGRIARRRVDQLAGVPAPALPADMQPGVAAGLGPLAIDPAFSFRPATQTAPTTAAPTGSTSPAAGSSPSPDDAPIGSEPGTEPVTSLPAAQAVVAAPAGPAPAEPAEAAAPASAVVEPPAPVAPAAAAAPAAPGATLVPEPAQPIAPNPPARQPQPPSVPAGPDPVFTRPITAAAGHVPLPSVSQSIAPKASPVIRDDEPIGTLASRPASEAGPAPAAVEASTPTVSPTPVAPSPGPAPARPQLTGGPQLRLEIAPDGAILASLDGSEPEPTSLEELREAAIALAEAGGSVSIVSGGTAGPGLDSAAQLVTTFDEAGVPTTVEPTA
jgi:hypothetical protein